MGDGPASKKIERGKGRGEGGRRGGEEASGHGWTGRLAGAERVGRGGGPRERKMPKGARASARARARARE